MHESQRWNALGHPGVYLDRMLECRPRAAGKGYEVKKLLLLVALTLTLAGCGAGTVESGVLAGHVTIGPLTPVQQEGVPNPTPAPEVYAARQVVVFGERGRREVLQIEIQPNGEYRAALPAGRYRVDINHAGIDSAARLPALVEIFPGQVTQLDIDIDTGIR